MPLPAVVTWETLVTSPPGFYYLTLPTGHPWLRTHTGPGLCADALLVYRRYGDARLLAVAVAVPKWGRWTWALLCYAYHDPLRGWTAWTPAERALSALYTAYVPAALPGWDALLPGLLHGEPHVPTHPLVVTYAVHATPDFHWYRTQWAPTWEARALLSAQADTLPAASLYLRQDTAATRHTYLVRHARTGRWRVIPAERLRHQRAARDVLRTLRVLTALGTAP